MLEVSAELPSFCGVHFGGLLPLRLLGVGALVELDVFAPERLGRGVHPRAGMHAVGDRTNGDVFGLVEFGERLDPHVTADFTMEFGNTVDVVGEPQGQDGHAE